MANTLTQHDVFLIEPETINTIDHWIMLNSAAELVFTSLTLHSSHSLIVFCEEKKQRKTRPAVVSHRNVWFVCCDSCTGQQRSVMEVKK